MPDVKFYATRPCLLEEVTKNVEMESNCCENGSVTGSFSSGGKFNSNDECLEQAIHLFIEMNPFDVYSYF